MSELTPNKEKPCCEKCLELVSGVGRRCGNPTCPCHTAPRKPDFNKLAKLAEEIKELNEKEKCELHSGINGLNANEITFCETRNPDPEEIREKSSVVMTPFAAPKEKCLHGFIEVGGTCTQCGISSVTYLSIPADDPIHQMKPEDYGVKERPMTEGEKEIAKALDEHFAQPEGWEERFDKEFKRLHHTDDSMDSLRGMVTIESLKDFIRSLLSEERERVRGIAEKSDKKIHEALTFTDWANDWGTGIDKIVAALEDLLREI